MIASLKQLGRWASRRRGRPGAAPRYSETVSLRDPAELMDPYAAYRRLREEGEVLFLPRHGFWIALSHQAVRSAFAQPAAFSNAPYEPVDSVLLAADPPGHGDIRRTVSRFFGGKMLNAAEAEAARVASSLLRPRLDVVAEFGLPLSRAVTSHVVGFDEGVADHLASREEAFGSDPSSLPRFIAELDAVAHRSAMFRQLRAGDGPLSAEPQARSLVRLMWLAGTVTTERVITRCVLQCLADPALAAALRERPELRPGFVEEVLRMYPPEHMVPRRTTADTTLGGIAIPAGSPVQLCTAAANRDPARYRDADAFLIDRADQDHFTLGHGIHACLGGPLARRIIVAAVSALLDHSTSFREVRPLAPADWLASVTTLTPRRLEIVLER